MQERLWKPNRAKEKCAVNPLRTSFSICALNRDYAAFAISRSDLKPARTSCARSWGCSHAAK